MKERDILRALERKTVFSVQDVQRLGNFHREYSKLVLFRLLKSGLVKRVTKNSYTLGENILVVSSNLKTPSYISLWSASSFYGFTEQILNKIDVVSTRKISPINFEGYKIHFVRAKNFFGYKKIQIDDGEMFMVEQEKLLLDCFLHFKEMGNFDEIIKVFEKAEVSTEKVVEYLKRIGNQSLIKRVGFMLEKYKGIDLSKNFKLDRNYVFLNQFSKRYKSINSKWLVKI